MKKIAMMVCGAAMFGMATLAQAQVQDTASTNYNNQGVEQQDQSTLPTQDQPTLDQPTQDQPTLDQPTQDQPTLDQPTQTPPVQDPALDRPTQDPALDQPTQDEPVNDGTNAIPQGQSRESQDATQDQIDQSTQSTDPAATDPSMERPSEVTPVEGKSGPNGEAVFMENGKYYYMDEAGEKKKIKKSELQDKIQ